MKDLTVLDQLIVGRVDPHIYAFTTNTIPNYLKVGDTYRPVAVRLREWKEHFPDLQKEYESIAKVNDDTYFRDFAVHSFLEQEKHRTRLMPDDLTHGEHYSREFFRDATVQDVEEAIADIQKDFKDSTNKYQFYNADTHLPETHTYSRTEDYPPRPNQDKTIKKFKEAIENGRTNLLMYAVMRFGKSFTSMCCAVEMGAKIVAIVSAKADVREEWKKTVESHIYFKDYLFLTGESLISNESIIKETLETGNKVVVFLTLQDLQGGTIKEKHRELFGQKIDLLIVDESHFGARAEKYGKVLRKEGKQHPKDEDDYIDLDEAREQVKFLDARITLHLSGTPYRILMGSEFSPEDIIAFYQFADIVKEQEEWTKANDAADEPKEEWENPYYGFPQMIRFAFNPNETSRQRLKELRQDGTSYAFSALLKPQSVKKANDGSHKQFVYEQEIFDLLSVIDGSKEDDELLGFLDYDKIKSGSMCRHIVCVLPYCASCDAMEALILNNAETFKNLNDYEIVNISGVDKPNAYKSPADIKRKISECEEAGKKTLTLTVNRMLTGSTVEQWDTMLFLKDTASPQEYDQAIFRLQNQYVKKYVTDDGHMIKYNMKPQTLLVDFDPNRMFTMQEQKSQIYNVNVDEAGNSRLEERISEELRISPIVVMNHDKMEQVQAVDILRAVSEYSKTRGVAEETAEIPVDSSLLYIPIIRSAIEHENELGSKAGFPMNAHENDNDGSEMDTPDSQTESGSDDTDGTAASSGQDSGSAADIQADKEKKDVVKQFRSYYARILFFAFLTKDTVISLEDIIAKIETPDNARIAENIGIKKPVLEAIQDNINKFILPKLDYKIHHLSDLSNESSIDPIERASVALKQFGKLGESEVVTPKDICDDMIGLIPDDGFIQAVQNGHKILDIAGKEGEFALAVYQRLSKLGCDANTIKNTIYTIPTSGITYEFTRKMYEILGLNLENLAEKFTSYDLLNVRNSKQKIDYGRITNLLTQKKPFNAITLQDDVNEGDEKVKFDVVVGNPPYQQRDGGAQSSAKPVYHFFVNQAEALDPSYLSIIMPARWYAGGKGLNEFRLQMINDKKIRILHDYLDASDCFQSEVEIKGGLCYFLRDSCHEGLCKIYTHNNGNHPVIEQEPRLLREENSDIMIRHSLGISIYHKVKSFNEKTFDRVVSSQKPFGLRTYVHGETAPFENSIALYERGGVGYISRDIISKNEEWLDKFKVFISAAYNAGDTYPHQILGKPIIGGPGTCCTETYVVIGPWETNTMAENVKGYIKTKFFRFLVMLKKSSQHAAASVYSFVPIQDFSKPWTDTELYEKYGLTGEETAFIEATIKPME